MRTCSRGCVPPGPSSTRRCGGPSQPGSRTTGRSTVRRTPSARRLRKSVHPTHGGAMPTIMAHRDVNDTDHWLASPKREEFFGPLGVPNIRTFVDPTNRTRVGVLMDVPHMDAVMAALETPGAREAMAHDGVLPETLVILVEE